MKKEAIYCEEHQMYKLKNALGTFVCPFCVRGNEEYISYA